LPRTARCRIEGDINKKYLRMRRRHTHGLFRFETVSQPAHFLDANANEPAVFVSDFYRIHLTATLCLRKEKEHLMQAEPNRCHFQDEHDAVPIIGGTLCLMSCALTSLLNESASPNSVGANTFYIKRISDNLALLASDVRLDSHFRCVCRRLLEHWDSRLNTLRLNTADDMLASAETVQPSVSASTNASNNLRENVADRSAVAACMCVEALASTIRFH
jgi:hypothetical protein